MNALRPALFACALFTLLPACRNASSSGDGSFLPLAPSVAGTDGCNGADQVFTPGQAFTPVVLSTWSPGPMSQVAGARAADELFLTGAGATLVKVDLTGAPVETQLIGPGVVAGIVDPLSLGPAPELSGLCVLDTGQLLVMEHTFNVVLMVSRNVPDTVSIFAGIPNQVPGSADGASSLSRFSFAEAAQLVTTATGRVLVADSGNHSIRSIQGDIVTTLSGTGAPFFADGALAVSLFDTPSGLSIPCSGRLWVTELGGAGGGGHRLRALEIGLETFFGQLGSVETLVGDGMPLTVEGTDLLASLAAPMGLVTSADGEAYFVDSTNGILRRFDQTSGLADCPLWTDCAAAVTGGGRFTPGGVVSLVTTDAGVLYALDASAGSLLRVTP